MHLIKVLFIALFFHVTFQANSQHDLFDHPEAMNLVSKGTEKIYQLDMDSALYYIRKLNKLIPNHPVIP